MDNQNLQNDKITVVIAWAKKKRTRIICDLNLYCILLREDHRVYTTISYDVKKCKGVFLAEESRAVDTEIATEKMQINLGQVADKVQQLVLVVDIFGAVSRKQDFTSISQAMFVVKDGNDIKFEKDLPSFAQQKTTIPVVLVRTKHGWQLQQKNLSSAEYSEYIESFIAKFNKHRRIYEWILTPIVYPCVALFFYTKISTLSIWQILLSVIGVVFLLPQIVHMFTIALASIGKDHDLEHIHYQKSEFVTKLVCDMLLKDKEDNRRAVEE
ncbi:TerD family protein [Candidatus Uabimicrobium amorphum]|uniref:TerD domain-containing protein n=1 Tax=Uabimicrobium amorphum TaxID=2596890 RepID=A0A5S9F3Q2_UABAM|nr:TerD family protein [Candidatus Uabimicrobium amorphum]BBM83769.1 hypothetical protein UABAM_02124 [Candidatus Uabimicrobium amorphum]